MSESSNEFPPIRVAQANPWTGLPPQGVVQPGRPLTYGERELLNAFLRFRDRLPPQSWLLLRGAVHGTLMLVLFGILVGFLWGGAYAFLTSDSGHRDYGADAGIGWGALLALTAWLGLTYGFLVRDQLDLRQTVSAWHIVQRVIKFETAERLLGSGMMLPESGEQGVEEPQR